MINIKLLCNSPCMGSQIIADVIITVLVYDASILLMYVYHKITRRQGVVL